jgi:peptidoglycan/LPS O-acetylase OafA/YrhL
MSTSIAKPTMRIEACREAPAHGGHMPALDGLRGVAILSVLFFHFYVRAELNDGGNAALIQRLLSSYVTLGRAGVNLFFVLSGFLITGILLDTKERPGFFRNFYVRRVLRIFPLYYGMLAVFTMLSIAFPESPNFIPHQQVWLWTYTSNIYEAIYQDYGVFTRHFWSLAVEEQFYLLWPMVVYWCKPKTLLRICACTSVVALGCRLAVIPLARVPDSATVLWSLLPCKMDGLVLGAAAAVAARTTAPWCWSLGTRLFWPSIMMILVAQPFMGQAPLYANALFETAVNCAALSLLLFAVSQTGTFGKIRSVLSTSVLRFFGKYSYGMYVLHIMAWSTAVNLLPRAGAFLRMAAAMAITVLAAHASFHLYESPFLKLKRHFGDR